MIRKIYEFKIEKYDDEFRIRLTNYHDEDRNGKCTTPISREDKMIVGHLKGLLKKLDSEELNVKLELK
ncbi:hypothetical protein HYS72_01260 [Candidatus Pacearchaeota archaeon]|nr:hypothetical protein [Candidatus Pacearchaeota archaeon]